MPESRESAVAYIGLGSNLGDSFATIMAACRELKSLFGTDPAQCASLYKSAPVGTGLQPDFINSVCLISTSLTAEDLLHSLMGIEQKFGRRRTGAAGEARTLDLDLLLYGELVTRSAQLTLPHPRLHERAFVLYPLHELTPNLIIPGHGRVSALLQQCQHQPIERLAGRENFPAL